MSRSLVTLVVLDGWGLAPPGPGNAVDLADTSVFDGLRARYPDTELRASGEAVGLPSGQMGNSEVGHLTIGSGRILFQDLMRVNAAIVDGSFFDNDALVHAFARARERQGDVHLLGLVSRGGVHSHLDHLVALLELAERAGMGDRTWIHAFTDGRDVSPVSAAADLAELPADRIATVCGRYYAMDRDQRWDRTQRAFDAIVGGVGDQADDPVAAMRASYERGITDEFIEPVVLRDRPRLRPDSDTAIFFNFRPDRGRQLARLLLDAGVDLTTMTKYADDLDVQVVFAEQEVRDTLAEVLSEHGVRKLHVAETEKYAHVTYFFNGGIETPYPGEERLLVPSQKVATYDLMPEMSAPGVTDVLCKAIEAGHHDFVLCNYANGDMVGHSGVLSATVKAVETVDQCLERVVKSAERRGATLLITADHGNCELMIDPITDGPHTAHTTNPVPFLLVDDEARGPLRHGGALRDVGPTVLRLLDIQPPPEMTGRDLRETD
jgi:2,3-bisphosphoglycerate-independent phosphoglycerate mutase